MFIQWPRGSDPSVAKVPTALNRKGQMGENKIQIQLDFKRTKHIRFLLHAHCSLRLPSTGQRVQTLKLSTRLCIRIGITYRRHGALIHLCHFGFSVVVCFTLAATRAPDLDMCAEFMSRFFFQIFSAPPLHHFLYDYLIMLWMCVREREFGMHTSYIGEPIAHRAR